MIHGMGILDNVNWPTINTHIRIWDAGVTWKDIHLAPNVCDWSRLDSIVNAHPGANFTYVIHGTPLWLAEHVLQDYAPWIGPGCNCAPTSMTHWQWFVIQLATRYLGKIGSYQIWNEPQLKMFWGYDDWATLAEMTRIANNAIHAVSPSIKTISGAVLPRPSSGGMTRGGKYLKALRDKYWPVDIYAAHMYPEQGYTPGRFRTFAQDWQAKLTELNAPARPKWVTETNYNLFGGPLSLPAQDDYIQRTQTICEDEGIFKCYWYAWMHSDPNLLGIPFYPGSQGAVTLASMVQ